MVRALTDIVKESHIQETEYLTTVLLAIPK